MIKSLGVALPLAFVLAACGGGGGGGGSGSGGSSGGVLYVSLVYPSNAISLYQEVTVQPQLLGFEGRTPVCTLVGGAMPAGLQLRSDCSITGRATDVAFNLISIRVSANGVSNTIDVDKLVEVIGPTLEYANRRSLGTEPLGSSVSDVPSTLFWTPGADLSMAWSYQIEGGTLPPGVSFDPATGLMSGNLQSAGVYSVLVRATLQTQFGTFLSPAFSYSVGVNVPTLQYQGVQAYVSRPFAVTPTFQGTLLPDATFSNWSISPPLPAGITIDASGVISGTPTAELRSTQTHDVTAVLTQGGSTASARGTFRLDVSSPVYITYPLTTFPSGTPVNLAPTVSERIPLSPGVGMNYSLPASRSCVLPPGVSVDGPTGVISGSTAYRGFFSCDLDVTITNNGVTWTDTAWFGFQIP